MKLLATMVTAIAIASPMLGQEEPSERSADRPAEKKPAEKKAERPAVPIALAPAARVATVNIGLVFTKYEKAHEMKKMLEADLAPLKAKAEKIKVEMKGFQTITNSPNDHPAEVVADAQDQLRKGTRQLEDLDTQARRLIGKKQETQLIELWVDIKTAIAEHATAKDYDVVLAYGDPPDDNWESFASINRKMNAMDAGGVTPIYIRNGADISAGVLTQLNDAYRLKKSQGAKDGSPPVQ